MLRPQKARSTQIKKAMIEKHVAMIRQARRGGRADRLPAGDLLRAVLLRGADDALVRLHRAGSGRADDPADAGAGEGACSIALIVPVYEIESGGRLLQHGGGDRSRRGSISGKYRKTHIPHVAPGFWEKFYFRPGNLGYPVFDLGFCKIGVYICYDRHFPEGARALGLNGAEIVFNPSATVAGLSEYLWKLEQPAHAVANGYFVGAINRVGTEAPWNIGEFYGQSYFCDPRGQIFAQASRDKDEVLTADLDLDKIAEVRKTWQFFRDRRPDQYGDLVKP